MCSPKISCPNILIPRKWLAVSMADFRCPANKVFELVRSTNTHLQQRMKIRPHRFGGEGVLIGGQNSNTKCSMTFVNIAVAISALAGGAKTVSHRDQNTVVFATFFEDFWVSERKRVLKWNFGSFW